MAMKKDQESTISRSRILDTVFFDIETTTRYRTFEEYMEKEPVNAMEFSRISRNKYPADQYQMSVENIYQQYGMLYPEHGQVVSIAFKYKDVNKQKFESQIYGFGSWEEYDQIENKRYADRNMLLQFNLELEDLFGDMDGALGGYCIKTFDIPYIYKRMLTNGILPHHSLRMAHKKPWDIEHLDLYDYWNVGVNGMSSFGVICETFGIDNPKTEYMDGTKVGARFWDDHAVEDINKYCLHDADASLRLAWALSRETLELKYREQVETWLSEEEARRAAMELVDQSDGVYATDDEDTMDE